MRQQTTMRAMELKWSQPMLFVSQIISSFQGRCGNTCCYCLPHFGLRIHSSLSNLTHIYDKKSTSLSGILGVGYRSWAITRIMFRYLMHIMCYNVYFSVMTLKSEIPLEIWRGIRQQEESKKKIIKRIVDWLLCVVFICCCKIIIDQKVVIDFHIY